jgi:YVTN family beta-propeller protein
VKSFSRFPLFAALFCLVCPVLAWAAAPNPVFVLNSLDGNVSVIDPATWKEVKRIPTGKEPHHLYMTPDEKSVIVANALSDSLTFIDPRTAEVQREVRGILDPYHLRFSPDMKWFVTAANRLNHVDIYRWDGRDMTLAKRISTGKTPSHLWIDSKSTTVWSTMQDSDELVAIDLTTQALKWRVKTGPMPADVFGTLDDKTVLVGLTGRRRRRGV